MTPLKLGMVGGGEGAFIGAIHRMAARLDGRWTLTAGAFSSDAARAARSAKDLGIAPDRSYATFQNMAVQEAQREDGIDAVSIVTPNHLHVPAAIAFLEQGIPVICDKPLAATLEQAEALRAVLLTHETPFFLTHNYTGYPLVRQARQLVQAGRLGALRVCQVEYAQDWMTQKLEDEGSKQAEWRTDPNRSGLGGSIGDIGTHAFNLLNFVIDEVPNALMADLQSFVDGRVLDDNAHILLRYASGARGMMWSSQVAPGNENGLRLRIYGEKAGLEWSQEDPNALLLTEFSHPTQRITRAGAGYSAGATRIPAGHPEGYLEAFATLYSEIAETLSGNRPAPFLVPGIQEGLDGMAFISKCVESSTNNGQWQQLHA